MEKAAFKFEYNGIPQTCEPFGNGHINKSLIIETDTGYKYVLQSISTVAFHDVPGLMENAIAVSKHIANKNPDPRASLNFIKAKDGKYYYVDENGEYWRTYEFVRNSMTIEPPTGIEEFYQSAVAFGMFQNQLTDYPAETLCETIPHFHDTPDRYRIFREILVKDPCGRAQGVKNEIDFCVSREADASNLQHMRDEKILPVRVTHNDTKINNVLFDIDTHEPLCVIDLDTVMPGLSAFDFGDAIRFGASTAAEDEKDLDKVHLNLEMFRAFAKGFISSCPGLTEKEIEVLPLGAKTITLENGLRFLTDYIDGDHYFGITYPEHNLDRARTQFKLVEEMEAYWAEMNKIISEER